MYGNELKKEFGDYQTPEYFAENICSYLYNNLNIRPQYIIEPTAGIGNFIKASLKIFKQCQNIVGIELNEQYCKKIDTSIQDERVHTICDNFFDHNLFPFRVNGDETLIIGNPPWVMNSNLKFNMPLKSNFKKLKGLDAITGSGNFDICEYIILKLIDSFKNTNAVIAMLCKTSVARNIFHELNMTSEKVEYIKIINFNASKIFKVGVSACLLVVKLSNIMRNCSICEVSDIDERQKKADYIYFKNGKICSDNSCKDLDGKCKFEWRQGVKHDCAKIMELEKISDHEYQNKNKEIIRLENDIVFPLIKSSDFKRPIINCNFKKFVIVTQKSIREDTAYIELLAPNTWKYLNDNKEMFDRRKSSIYKGAPSFSMFGVGHYSYSKYKVGVSGFYKTPLFSLLYNAEWVEHPVMLDDTSYFLSFDGYNDAYVCMLLLNCELVQNFLCSISFKDSKRPFTKKILQRLDFEKCFHYVTFQYFIETEKKLNLPPYITEKMYDTFKARASENHFDFQTF